ncbi:ankyrin repeat domain-containing protein [Nocardia sp. NPDC051990]|uniref:ankyrin repeat domain-containing protein n=1 Tax=Nocardia sp. NPDC051990 TaxID=3155285 RepID=UPI003422B87D
MGNDETDPDLIELATKIFDLARHGDAEQLTAYLDAGVPVNLTNNNGDTLLMLAAYHGHQDVVQVLLARDADPNRANDKGQTPLAGAVFKGETEILRALLAVGADPDAGTPSARAAAAMFGKSDVLNLFEAS